jgi:anti-anti-sigma factor
MQGDADLIGVTAGGSLVSTIEQPLVGFLSHEASSVVLSGEIDLANVVDMQTLVDHAINTTDGTVKIDMGDVTYLDTTGLHVLLTASDQLRQKHRRLLITSASRQALRLLEICGLTAHLMTDMPDSQLSAAS